MKSLLEKLKEKVLNEEVWKKCPDAEKEAHVRALCEEYGKATYYEVLGIPKPEGYLSTVDSKNVRSAYLATSKGCHPDKTTVPVIKEYFTILFRLTKDAYDTLSEPSLERKYRLTLPESSEQKDTKSESKSNSSSSSSSSSSSFSHSAKTESSQKPSSKPAPSKPTYSSSTASGVYNRDIAKEENISTVNDDITITGDIYGNVSTVNGDIKVTGKIYGHVSTVNGAIKVTGEVHGKVSSVNGSIKVVGNVYGSASSLNGSTKVIGNNYGSGKSGPTTAHTSSSGGTKSFTSGAQSNTFFSSTDKDGNQKNTFTFFTTTDANGNQTNIFTSPEFVVGEGETVRFF
jgi:hypothetical protein